MLDVTGKQITLVDRVAWVAGGNNKSLVVGRVTGWDCDGQIALLLTEKGKRKVRHHQSESYRIIVIERGTE